ncbi:MAG TPA: hypothetical protein VG939_18060 [Caulobacteraceae bacterium]|nr:hypothetical protein [Caulobacteraceae bacterium]
MAKPLIFFVLATATLTTASAAGAEADRHAGVYRFTPLPPGWCVDHPPPAAQPGPPPRVQRLDELPAAYFIQIAAPHDAPPAPLPFATPAAPAYDPCAHVAPTLMRVR